MLITDTGYGSGLNLLLTILKMMREQMKAVKEMRAETFNQGNGSSSSSFAPLVMLMLMMKIYKTTRYI